MAPIMKISAEIGPTMRSGSCWAGSMPNSGACGRNDHGTFPGRAKAHMMKISAVTARKLLSDSARPEALCTFFSPAARTSSELSSTSL